MPTPMPPHVAVDAAATAFDGLVVVPMMRDRFPDLLDNYGWLARAGDRVAAFDAARAEPLLDAARAMGWTVTDVLLTHHHPDHVDGVAALREATGAAVWGAAADAHRLPTLDHAVAPGDAVALGPARGSAWDVSGHTIGHLAYVFDGIAFTGDSLMAGGCGRLFEGTPARMHASLALFDALDGAVLVASGHEYTATNLAFAATLEPGNRDLTSRGAEAEALIEAGRPAAPTTLDLERRTNPFLRSHVPAVKAATGTDGATDVETFAAARSARDAF